MGRGRLGTSGETVNFLIVLVCVFTFVVIASCTLPYVEGRTHRYVSQEQKLTVLYTGSVLGEIEPCG